MTTYKPGSFFVTRIPGWAGNLIGIGQALALSPSRYEHAGMIISEDGDTVEAAPGGAFVGHMRNHRIVLVSDGPVQRTMRNWEGQPPLPWSENALRQTVVFAARALIGTPYSPLDYVALAALHLHLPSKWIRQRVESSGHLICSALVDRAYQNAGIHLFDDGRLAGDVMPSDLAAWAEDFAAGGR